MSSKINSIDGVALVCFYFFSEANIKFYTLYAYGETDVPLFLNKKIVFFCTTASVSNAFSLFPKELLKNQKIPSKTSLVCDIPTAIKKIQLDKLDQNATILNCLNMFFDMLRVIKVNIPKNYKDKLFSFADYLTFNKNLGEFFSNSQIKREEMLEAFVWCIGKILSNCKLLDQ